MTFDAQQDSYDAEYAPGIVGEIAHGAGDNDCLSMLVSAPQAKQIETVTVDTASSSTEYSLPVNGVAIAITSDSSATKTEIAAALVDAINNEVGVNSNVVAAASGSDALTLTSRREGESFTVDDSDSNLSGVATQAAASADPIAYARAVLSNGLHADGVTRLCKLASGANMTAQVISFLAAGTAEDDKALTVRVIVGHDRRVDVTFPVVTGSSATDTKIATAIKTAANTALPASSVLADSSTGTVTFTAEVPGEPIWVEMHYVETTTGTLARSGDTGSSLTDIGEGLAGITRANRAHVAAASSSDLQYAANTAALVARRASIRVESEDTVAAGRRVYVRLANATSTKPLGGFASVHDTGLVALPASVASWESFGTTQGANVVRVSASAPV